MIQKAVKRQAQRAGWQEAGIDPVLRLRPPATLFSALECRPAFFLAYAIVLPSPVAVTSDAARAAMYRGEGHSTAQSRLYVTPLALL